MKNKVFLSAALMLALVSCNMKDKQNTANKAAQKVVAYTNENNTIQGGMLTPEVLWMFGRIGDVSLSLDGKNVLYTVAWTDLSKNKSYKDLLIKSTAGGDARYLLQSEQSLSDPVWTEQGNKVAYLAKDGEDSQLFVIEVASSKKTQITHIEGGIQGFKFSPDSKKLMYVKGVVRPNVKQKYPDLPLANARVEDDLMYRHWDAWLDEYAHVFVADIKEDGTHNDLDIMKDEPWESPVRPFGGVEQITWTPQGDGIIYCSRKKEGLAYSISTNTDLYLYTLSTGKTENLSAINKGYDLNPSFSPDGKYLVWESMEHEGYESDVNRLAVMDYATRKITFHEFGINAGAPNWAKEGNNQFYFTSDSQGTANIYSYTIGDKEPKQVASDICDYKSVEDAGDVLIASRQSITNPTEIFRVDKATGKAEEISFVNKKLMAQLTMPTVEKRMIKTFDNKDMLTWVIYPPHFDRSKKYPTLLYCQGGPQDMVSQFFSYRWNFSLMASNGYIIVAPNRRGLPGFGKEWNAQISKDYGGKCMKDYLTASDELAKEPFVDQDKMGAIGASFGGYSVYWLAGNHEKRFKCFVSHCGIFDFKAMYLSTDEMFFENWEIGGNFWDKNPVAERSFTFSPSNFIKNWDTPILCITGANDFRIPYTQTMEAFHAARLKGIDARFLFFPDESHWVLQPQNGVVWHREFFEWLDKYLK